MTGRAEQGTGAQGDDARAAGRDPHGWIGCRRCVSTACVCMRCAVCGAVRGVCCVLCVVCCVYGVWCRLLVGCVRELWLDVCVCAGMLGDVGV